MPPADPITLDSGAYQAQVFPATGRIALAGPDPTGKPLANVITLEPIQIQFPSGTETLGPVIGTPLRTATSLEVEQQLGGVMATTRITFLAEGVMRFEVRDWGGPTPKSASITGLSEKSEHFIGFGERFNKLDQAGRVVKMQAYEVRRKPRSTTRVRIPGAPQAAG